jgi:hypothetical protein
MHYSASWLKDARCLQRDNAVGEGKCGEHLGLRSAILYCLSPRHVCDGDDIIAGATAEMTVESLVALMLVTKDVYTLGEGIGTRLSGTLVIRKKTGTTSALASLLSRMASVPSQDDDVNNTSVLFLAYPQKVHNEISALPYMSRH